MSELVTAGEHNAKILDYGVTTSAKGDPMVVVKFQTDVGTIFWNGLIREAPEGKQNHTLKALIIMGLKSINELESIADGPESKALDMDQEVKITVNHEEYNGKMYAKVQWVNALSGGAKFKNVMEKQDLKVKLAGMKSLKSDFASAWQETGGSAKPKAAEKDIAPEIPF